MPDESPKKRPLSEIGHLFLSSVRDQHLGGVTPPRRLPPGARGPRPGTAVIAGHLTGTQLDRARQYARHLAARDGRIGLIELDASEFRLMCFEAGAIASPEDATPPLNPDCYNVREITESIE